MPALFLKPACWKPCEVYGLGIQTCFPSPKCYHQQAGTVIDVESRVVSHREISQGAI